MVENVWKELQVPWSGVGVCCYICFAPQAICHHWENVGHGGPSRYRAVRGRTCQFKHILREAAAAVIGLGGEAVAIWMEEETRTRASVDEEEYIAGWEGMERWLGKKIEIEGIDMSALCCTFWRYSQMVQPEEHEEEDPSSQWSF